MFTYNKYLESWMNFGSILELEIEVVATSELGISVGTDQVILLKNFGNKNGMLLFPDDVRILSYSEHLNKLGYGYSVLKEPSVSFLEELEGYKEILLDWKLL